MNNERFPHLFSPARIGNVELRNRIVHSPHGEGSEDAHGFVSDRSVGYHVERAKGGMGLLLFGDVSIEQGEYNVSLGEPAFIPRLRDLTDEVHFWGAKIFAHITYTRADPIYQYKKYRAGEQTEEIVTVSGVSPEEGVRARPLTILEITAIEDMYARAAYHARLAGFDGVSINGAYGFLPAQFLSSRSNRRADEYGGDITGRTRFLTEIICKTRQRTGDAFPIMLKLSADEFRDDGLTLEDTVAAARILEERGISALFIVAGTQSLIGMHRIIPPLGTAPFGCFVPLAEAVKKAVGVPIIVGTRINDPQLGEQIISEGRADLIALCRASIADPEWSNKAKEGHTGDINKCIYCNRCLQAYWPVSQHRLRCSVNASVYKEREYVIKPAVTRKKVLIAGGGPAGMEAAKVAALRGHEVTLCDRNSALGGQLLLAARAPHKEEISSFVEYLVRQIGKSGISVKLNTTVTADMVRKIKPDVLIVATGAEPLVPGIEGAGGSHVVTAWDVLAGRTRVGDSVVVAGGGMVGCEVAEYLTLAGKNVTIVEELNEIAADVELTSRIWMMERFANYKLNVVTGAKVQAILEHGVVAVDATGKAREIMTDTVVLALGACSNDRLAKELEGKITCLYSIGDCRRPRRILEAVHDAAYIARQI